VELGVLVALEQDRLAKIQFAQQLHLAAVVVAAVDIKIPAHYLVAQAAVVTTVTLTMQVQQAQLIKVMLAVRVAVHRNQLVVVVVEPELLVNKIRLAAALVALV
jgi:hypothetical protein